MLNASDLSRFNDAFIEEAAEHLAEMERILLALDPASPDIEELNAVFRSAHSIKGGAGIFGFCDLMEVTHHLESLLDLFRSGGMAVTTSLVDLCLAAADVVAMQLAGHRDGTPVDEAAVKEISGRLAAAAGSAEAGGAVPAADTHTLTASGLKRFDILFKPGPETLKRGIRIEGLFTELAELGKLAVTADFPEIQALEEFDPELCHARWRIVLETKCDEAELRDIFEFVADDSDITIVSDGCVAETAGEGDFVTVNDANLEKSKGNKEPADASIRIALGKVDQLVNQVGELVITQAMLAQLGEALDPVLFESLHRGLQQLQRNTRTLQESVLGMRLVPIGSVFSRFPRLVRDLAAKLGKRVELRIQGESTELDRGLIERITDPLTHLVRNALDHGIEVPQARSAAGKNLQATITLRASQVGGRIVVEVADDGAGLHREKILRRAAERGLAVSDTMSDEEVWHLVLSPGFSTAEAVTDISGRGVGMDVVVKNVQAMGGRMQIFSEEGRGSRFVLSLPLTLAILDGLSVGVGSERFIIPLNAIVESFQPQAADVQTVQGNMQVVNVRGDYIPIVPLRELFALDAPEIAPEEGVLVLVDAEGTRRALLVNELLGQHQVVIKSLEENYRKVPGTAGASILGDGKVALILDVGEIVGG